MSIDFDLTSQEQLADLSPAQPGSSSASSSTTLSQRPVPGHRLGRGGLGGRQRHPVRAVPTAGLRHGARGVLRAGDRQPGPHAYVLRAGAVRFVIKGAVRPDSALADHHRRHGDGVIDIALEVPDVDRCVAHARAAGARIVCGAARRQPTPRHRPDRGDRRLRRHRAHAWSTGPATTARTCRAMCRRSQRGPRRRRPSALPWRSTTWSATSSSATWTSGWRSTTGSWASRTWPSSSATTSPPSTRR